MAAISIQVTPQGIRSVMVEQELVFFIGPSPDNPLGSVPDYDRRVDGDRSKSWPDTRMISLSLRDHRDVNAHAQALTDLGSHAFTRSSAGVSACVAAWSLLNHLKGA
ncbi:MAG: hypothetical protein AW08_03919 [Candidatus Accumulibacter adjunctus]|uniref:Uncharacterized protein n=1 Tax=Candidatus Accumulibacter adjunctus TaxID=1454001 RepID=A0A011NH62_9PROT|nr:MAG: hypothetical protein AW08_03919 [Candidatus Accumulibacter adjunctus]